MPDGARVCEYHSREKSITERNSCVGTDVPLLDHPGRLAVLGENLDEYASIRYYYRGAPTASRAAALRRPPPNRTGAVGVRGLTARPPIAATAIATQWSAMSPSCFPAGRRTRPRTSAAIGLLAVCALAGRAWGGPAIALDAAVTYTTAPVEPNMHSVVADFDNDGRLDIVADYNPTSPTAEPAHPFFALLRGDPDWATTHAYFRPYEDIAAYAGEQMFFAEDVDGDGLKDLVGVGEGRSAITVLINSGSADPLFLPAKSYVVGFVHSACTVDVNQDGKRDLVLLLDTDRGRCLQLFMASGAGASFGYTATWTRTGPPGGWTCVAVDPDQDGTADLVVHDFGGERLMYFAGAPDPAAPYEFVSTLAIPSYANLTSADLDNDGNPDLLLSYYAPLYGEQNRAAILVADARAPSGTFPFAEIASFPVDHAVDGATVQDLTNDGVPDIAMTGYGNCYVYLGGGTESAPSLSFVRCAEIQLGGQCEAPGFADLNDDGRPDFVAACLGAHHIAVVEQLEPGAASMFRRERRQEFPFAVEQLRLCDYDGDARPDALVSLAVVTDSTGNLSGGGVALLRAEAPLTMPDPYVEVWRAPDANIALTGDFNGDGRLDFLDGTYTCHLFQDVDGQWSFLEVANPELGLGSPCHACDVNGDGVLDLLGVHAWPQLGPRYLDTYLAETVGGVGTGRFELAYSELHDTLRYVFNWDVNEDGLQDIVLIEPSDTGVGDDLEVLLNDPAAPGRFAPGPRRFLGRTMSAASVADADGNGIVDIVVAGTSETHGPVDVLRNVQVTDAGEISLTQQRITEVGTGVGGLVSADLNGDGLPDLAIWSGSLYIAEATGDGYAMTPLTYATPNLDGLAPWDYNGDQLPDFVYPAWGRICFLENTTELGPQAVLLWGLGIDEVAGGVRLQWRLAAGADGARLYRSLPGRSPEWTCVTPSPVRPDARGACTFTDGAAEARSGGEVAYRLEVLFAGQSAWYGPFMHDSGSGPPAARALTCFPNPFNPLGVVEYAVERTGPVRLAVYDLGSRLVRVLLNADVAAGSHRISWDGSDARGRPVAAGVYFLRLESEQRALVRKVTLVR